MSIISLHNSVTTATTILVKSAIAPHWTTTTAFSLFYGNLQTVSACAVPCAQKLFLSFSTWSGLTYCSHLNSGVISCSPWLGKTPLLHDLLLFTILQFPCPKNILSILTKVCILHVCRDQFVFTHHIKLIYIH